MSVVSCELCAAVVDQEVWEAWVLFHVSCVLLWSIRRYGRHECCFM